MADKFHGTFAELKIISENSAYDGEWRDCGDKHQFRGRNGEILNLFRNGSLQFQGRNQQQFEGDLSSILQTPESAKSQLPANFAGGGQSAAPAAASKKIFVVHGHDEQAREQLELILNKLGLEAYILQNNDAGGRTLIEALEHNIYENSSAGIVLLTPDDFGYAKTKTETDKNPRARQNVILEMGMIMARLGRNRTVILKKGVLEMPSDIAGLQYHEFNGHVREIVPRLVQRLNELGFTIDAEKITRASA